jgi:hypothetical protein
LRAGRLRLIDKTDKPRDQRCCPETISFLTELQPKFGPHRIETMHPFRAFMISFALGSAALFGGYGVIAAMTPAPVGHTITV